MTVVDARDERQVVVFGASQEVVMREGILLGIVVLSGCVTTGGDVEGVSNNSPGWGELGQNTKYCGLSGNPVRESGDPLLGVYDGYWEDKLSQTVIIYDVEGGHVKTYYSAGVYKPWGIDQPGCSDVPGVVMDGEVVLDTFPHGAKVRYVLEGDVLHGTYTWKGQVTKGEFYRIDG